MEKNKTILFDFGGTLDTNGIHWSVMFVDTYKKNGIDVPEEKYNRAYVSADEDLKKLSKENIGTYYDLISKQAELQIKHLGIETDYAGKISEIIKEEMNRSLSLSVDVLSRLKNKYTLGLVSNFYGNLGAMCRSIGIAEYFSVMIDSESEGIEKPHPGIFSIALKRLNANPDDTYVVGDSYERDIVPAKILGCKTIWLKKKSFKENNNTGSADYIIGDLKEVLNICL